MSFFRASELPSRQLLPGVNLRVAAGDKTMITLFDFAPQAVIPSHHHPHEQITYIIAGEMEFTIDGETRILQTGDGVVVRTNQEHGAKVLAKPTQVIDAWYPLREDYLRPTQK